MVLIEPVGGGLFLVDSGETMSSPSWGLNLSLAWRLASFFHLGIRQTVDFGFADAWFDDGSYSLGTAAMCPRPRLCQPWGRYFLVLLGTRVMAGFDIGEYLALRPSVGIGMYGTEVTPAYTFIPIFSAGFDVDVALYRGELFSLRLGAELDVVPALGTGLFLAPQGGLSLEL